MHKAPTVFAKFSTRSGHRERLASRCLAAIGLCAFLSAALPARSQSCFTNASWTVRSDFSGTTIPSQPRSLRGLALSKNGAHVFAGMIQGSDSSSIRKLDAATGSVLATVLIGDSRQPKAVATDDRGYVYVATGAADGQFQIFDGSDMSLINVVTPSGTASIGGMSVRKSGSIYYLYLARDAAGSALIERYVVTDPMLVQTSLSFGTNGNGKFNVRNINSAAASLTGLEVASDGTIYQTDRDLNLIWKISADYLTVKSNSIPRAMDVVLLADKLCVSRYDSSSSDVVVLRQSDLVQVATIPTAIARDTLADTGYAGIDVTTDGRLYLADEVYSNTPPTLFRDRILVSTPIPTNIIHTCPPPVSFQCANLVPAGANNQAQFQAMGGTVACYAATVSSADGSLTPGPIDGTILRTYTLTDNYGNTASCTQTITVDDTTPPIVACPANVTVKTTSVSGTTVSYVTPVATDNCDPTPVVTCTPAAGNNFPIGTTTVTCRATDLGFNTNTCQFAITVLLQHNTNYVANSVVTDNNPNGFASTKVVSSSIGYLTDVNVTLHITNGWNGDLYAYLVHDSGFSVLLNRVGRRALDPIGYGDPGFNVTLDDSSPNDIHAYRFTLFGNHVTPIGGPLTGTWAVDGRAANPTNVVDTDPRSEFLSSFNSLNPNGQWTLFVADLESGDQSSLVDWGLQLCGLLPTPVAILAQSGTQTLQCSSNLTLGISLNATATLPLTNQWYLNGVAISGATGTNLNFSNIHPASSGTYTFTSCNMANCVTSAPIVITVVDTIAPAIATCATNLTICPNPAGQATVPDFTIQVVATDACSSVTVTQSPLAGTIIGSGITTVTLTAADAAGNTNACTVQFVVRTNTSATALNSLTLCPGLSAAFSTVASGTGPLTYQWTKNGANIGNATNASFSIPAVAAADGAAYCVIVSGACNSVTNCATLTVLTNTTATALANIVNACPGTSVSFSTTAAGSAPLTYQWTLGGVNIFGATNASYTIPAVAPADAGTYCVIVAGACNSVTNCATLSLAVAPTISIQPAGQVTPMGNGAVFGVTAAGTGPLGYQWRSNGVNIAGGTGSTVALSNLTLSASGSQISVVVSNCAGTLLSASAVLSVTPISAVSFDFNTPGQYTNLPYNLVGNDWSVGGASAATPPINGTQPFPPDVQFEVSTGGVGVATGGGGLDLTFNNGVDHSAILTPLTYDFSLTGKVLIVSIMTKVKVATAAQRAIHIGFITQTNGSDTLGKLIMAGVNGTANLGFMSAIFQSSAPLNVVTPSYHLRAQYKTVAGTAFETIPVNSPTNTLATNNWYKLVAKFVNVKDAGNSSSNYTVEATVQDMGLTGLTAGPVVLAMPPLLQTNFDMVNQKNLYFAIRSFENGGNDYFDNVYVTTRTGPAAFVTGPASQTVLQGRTANFQALVDGDGPYTYQWNRNGVPIAGAGNWKYTTPPLLFPADNGALYTVSVTSPSGTITSAAGTVTVQADALDVLSVGSVDGAVIGLRFDQPVTRASAEAPANYLINGTPAAAAQLLVNNGVQQYRTNGTEVLLTPASVISGSYTVTVANVTSLSGTVVGANNSATGQVSGLVGYDVDPLSIGFNGEAPRAVNGQVATLPGTTYSFAPGQFTVSAGGHDIFGTFDGFHYTYKRVTGNFDWKMRVTYMDIVRTTTKAGFDARLSLDPASPHVGAFADPALPARNFIEGVSRPDYNVGSVSWGTQPTNYYPNVWLRLRRVGNTFLRYSSTNGVNWAFDGQISSTPAGLPWPDTIYMGLAHNCNVGTGVIQQPSSSQQDNFGDFAGYPGALIAISSGPSNIVVTAPNAATFTNLATVTGGGIPAGNGELTYLWQRTNTATGGWTNMPSAGATNHILNTGALLATDNGAQFRVILSAPGALSVTSSVATLTITDTAGPTILAGGVFVPTNSLNQIVVKFSEFMSAATALNRANYTVTNGAGVVQGIASVSFLNGDARTVVITTSNALTGDLYGVRLTGVQDLGGNNITAGTLVTFAQVSGSPQAGPVVCDYYASLIAGGVVTDLVNHVKYIANTPDFIMYSNVFGVNGGAAAFPTSGLGDNYGIRMYSWFVPPTNGQYKFYLRADDFAEFLMNTNAVGSTNGPNRIIPTSFNSPAAQQAYHAMDNNTNSKYLNFDKLNTGFIVTPGGPATVVRGIRLATAGDAPERDPATFTLEGASSFAGPWTAIASGNTGLGGTALSNRLSFVPDVTFANSTAYASYRVLFPTVRDATAANSMQIAEVQLLDASSANILGGAIPQILLTVNNANYVATASVTNTLNAGQRYYMEVRFKETGGGDGAAVAMRGGADVSIPAAAEVIPSIHNGTNNLLLYPEGIAPRPKAIIELYNGLVNNTAPSGNGAIADLLFSTNILKFVSGLPDTVGYERYMGYSTNLGNTSLDNYMGRIISYFVPPANGNYRFYIRSDDSSILYMNTNAVNSTDPAGKRELGRLNAFTAAYTLAGPTVSLIGGQRYYMEGIWREGGGGDGMTVQVRAQSDASVPGVQEVILPNMLEFPADLDRIGPVNFNQAGSAGGLSPLNPVVREGETITFFPRGVAGSPPYLPVWLRNGQQVFANNQFYVTQPLTMADNGAVYTIQVSNLFSVVTASSTVTVLPDNTPPTIVSAVASQYGDSVLVTFSEGVDAGSAGALANYRIAGLRILSVGRDDQKRNRVSLRTDPQTPNTLYTLTVNGVRDLSSAGNPIAPNSTRTFSSWGYGGLGGVYVEYFTNIQNTLDEYFLTDPKAIYNMPDYSYYTNVFAAGLFGAETGLNEYALRISGCFMPPSNGLYRFFVRGDDATMLFMNTNGPAASGRVLLARNNGANSAAAGTFAASGWQAGVGVGGDPKLGSSVTPILSLTNNTPYYLEALLKEGGGGDHLEVLMRAIDPVTLTEIGGVPPTPAAADYTGANSFSAFLCAPGNPDGVTILQSPPAELFLTENDAVSLTLSASFVPPSMAQFTTYQWQRSNALSGVFTNVPGATLPTLSFFAPLSDNNARYRLTASMPGGVRQFATLLHVVADTIPPRIVAASSLNGTNIDICFNEPVEFNSGGDEFGYVVNGGANNVLSADVRSNNASQVTLVIDPPLPAGQPFTVSVTAVYDLASNPNVGDSSTNGRVQGYLPRDIGAPPGGGSSFSCKPGEIDVFAGGADIWTASDQGHMTLTPRCGNFDINLRVQSLTRAVADNDGITKAGLMVRDSLDPASRKLHVLLEPPALVGGRDFYEAGQRPTLGALTAAWDGGSATGTGPAGLPNGWVRIKRTGNLFTAYRSADGSNWTVATTTTLALSNTVYVGPATTAHIPSPSAATVFAEYRNIYIPDPPAVLTPPSPPSQTIALHGSATYSVVVSNPPNSGPLAYQWQRNGINLAGATNATLTLNNLQVSDSGTYTINAGNDGGCAVIAPVVLIVSNALPIVGTDMLMATQNVTMTYAATNLLGNDSDPEMDSLSVVAVSGILPVSFASDFNAGLPLGTAVYGNASVLPNGGTGDSGHLEINPSVVNAAGGFVMAELTPGRHVSAFSATFNLKIFQGSAEPADGMSFNFGSDLPDAATTGAAAEQGGTASGFSFCIDNYRFQPISVGLPYNAPGGGTATTSGLKVNYKGVVVAIVQTPGAWNQDRYVPVSINVAANGACTILVDGTNAFGTFTLPSYTPGFGRFGIYGRCGGQNQAHEVDDLAIAVNTLETTRPIPPADLGGGTLNGNAYVSNDNGVNNSGALHLTDASLTQSGSFLLNELTPGKAVASFTASFKLRIGNGSGNAADGFSFNLAGDLPPLAVAAEEGAGTGLSLCIDNYPTGGVDSPSFKLKLGGTQLGLVLMPKWNSTAYIPVNITLTAGGQLTVNVNGTNVVSSLALPYVPITGRFGMYGRTGGEFETHWVDDLSINVTATDSSTGSYSANFDSGTYGTVSLASGVITYVPPTNGCGMDSYYYIVSDGQSGGFSTGRVDVVIKESVPTAPVIVSCASNRTLALPANTCQMALPDLTAQMIATDNCCCLLRTQNPAPGTMLNIGTYNVKLIVTDTMGLSATCTAVVVVADVTPPAIACSTNIVTECTGPTGAIVAYTVTASDDCNPNPSLMCAPASGTLFPNGTTTVNCNANDGNGNMTNCSFTVSVVDRMAPVVVCPPSRVFNLPPGQCGTNVAYANPTYMDCDTSATVVCTPASGSLFQAGATVVVNCTVTDASANASTCSFTIAVFESVKPLIACPPDVTVECGNPTTAPATGVATATDACDPNVILGSADHGTVEVRPAGLAGWTLSAVGDPLTGSATFVNGPSPAPVGTGSLRLFLGSNGDGVAQARTTNFHMTRLSALTELNFRTYVTASSSNGEAPFLLLNIDSDGNGTADDVIGFEPEYQSGYTLAVPNQGLVANGTWQKWDAMVGGWWSINHPGVMTDAGGVKSLATYIAAFPNARIVNASSGAGGMRLVAGQSFGTWEEFDGNVDRFTVGVNGASTLYDFDLTPGNPNSIIVRTWTATDHSSNAISCSQIINVVDTTTPSLVCPPAMLVKTTNPAGTNVSFVVTATDICDPSPTLVCTPASGTFFGMGATSVRCVVTDTAGNSNVCNFVVTVNLVDATNYTVNATIPDNNANGYASTKAVATQIGRVTDVNVRLNISGGYNGDLYAYLVHESGYSVLLNRVGRRAADPLGYSDTGFNLTIDDQASNGDVHAYRLQQFGNQTTPLAGALTNSWAPDGRSTDPAVVLDTDARTEMLSSFNGLNPNGDWTLFIADLGVLDTATLVSWSLDLCGLPPIPPSITLQPLSVTVQCSSNATFTVAATGTLPLTNQWYRNGIALPGENGTALVRSGTIGANGDVYTVIVRGMGGSITSSPANLTIIDTIAPVVVCPANIVTECATPLGATVTFTATVIESCSVGLAATCVPASGSVFPPGLTAVSCSASDAAHNVSASCSFTVRVVDTTAPAFCNNPAVVVSAGVTNDNFVGADAAAPSQDLKDLLVSLNLRGFDEAGSDKWFAHSFTNLPMDISDAVLRIRLRADAGTPQNDTVELLFATEGGGLLPASWNRRIGTGGFDSVPGLMATPWAPGAVTELVLNLGQLRNADNSVTDLLPTLHAQRRLDIIVQEDTEVDYIILETKSCQCRSNIIVSVNPMTCGAVVSFATPVFTDICDTNVPVVCVPASGSVFPIGTTTVFCSGTDDTGNIGHCAFEVIVTEPAPYLRINPSGSNVLLSWPVSCAHYRLLQAPSLTPPTSWTPVAAPISISGGEYHVLQPASGPYRFFRLVTP